MCNYQQKQGEVYITLPESKLAPENECLEDEFPFGICSFQGTLLLVRGMLTC